MNTDSLKTNKFLSHKSNWNWLLSRNFDLGFFYLPVWIIWGMSFLLSPIDIDNSFSIQKSFLVYLVVDKFVDYGHVFTTVFRTYLDSMSFRDFKSLLFVVPTLVLLTSLVVSFYSQSWFWIIQTYFAVYHFVRQQYGFAILYAQKEKVILDLDNQIFKSLIKWDKACIYVGTSFPIIY